MITQAFDLNLVPDSAPVVVHCDQYDVGTGRFIISLYNGSLVYSPASGAKAVIQGIKPDKKGFQYSASLSGNVVTADLKDQMSIVAGDVKCQIVVTEGTGRIGSFAFTLKVQTSALPSDSDMSQSDYDTISKVLEVAEHIEEYAETITDAVETVEQKASEASTSATNAATSASRASTSASNANRDALISEGYAKGTQNGSSVGSTSPYYQNNAKYYSDKASQDATSSASNASSAQSSATAASGSATAAATSATKAATSETNAKTSETNASASATAASGSATSASTSATNAKTSETNAKASETNAKTSETNAANSATAAATSESNASDSATAAASSESNASTSATNAATSATNAAASAASVLENAEDSEAWAVGQRDGVDVDPSDPAYHNNAKYWAGKSNASAFTGLTDVAVQNMKDGQFFEYDATEKKIVNKMVKTVLTAVLPAGESNLTVTSDAITETARFNVYAENAYITLEEVTTGTNSLTFVFPEQETNTNIRVVLIED